VYPVALPERRRVPAGKAASAVLRQGTGTLFPSSTADNPDHLLRAVARRLGIITGGDTT
jgi:hypothetical protein